MDSGGEKSSRSGFFSSIASGVRNWGSAVHKSVNGRSQKQFGLVEMHLEDGASWFTGQILTSHGSVSSNDGSVPGKDPALTETICKLSYWEELPCGIYSVCLQAPQNNTLSVKEELLSEVKKHEWNNPLLSKLIKWERTSVIPKLREFSLTADSLEKELYTNCSLTKNVTLSGYQHSIRKVLTALRDSVLRRTTVSREFQEDLHEVRGEGSTPIAILFSGGLDSMILGALLDKCLNPKYTIDLLNVSFDGQLAPDRVSAKAGLTKLQRISPLRRWRLVEIDASLPHLKQETEHVMSNTLIHCSDSLL